jgi:hypothetical protein
MQQRIIPIRPERPATLTVRASSWGALFDCSYKWYGEQVLKMRNASGLRAHLGTAIHAGTAAFDASRMPGMAPASLDDAAGVFVDTLHHPERDVDYSQDDLSTREAERIGLSLVTRYCAEVSPLFDFRGVEMTLQPLEIDCGGGVTVRLTGSMDRARLVAALDGLVIQDIKTGTRVIEDGKVKLKGRAPQLGTYELMVEHGEGLATSGAQITAMQTTSKPQVAVSPIFNATRVMVGTDDAPGLIELAAEMFRSGLFPPNPQSPLCAAKYCARWATCPYHE